MMRCSECGVTWVLSKRDAVMPCCGQPLAVELAPGTAKRLARPVSPARRIPVSKAPDRYAVERVHRLA